MASEPDAVRATEPSLGRPLGTFTDYEGLIAAIRARVCELQIAGEAFDEFAGLPSGYLSKLIGEHPIRRIGMTSLGPLFTALGVVCVLVENPEATEKLKRRVPPRNGSFVRSTRTVLVVTDRQWRKIQRLGRMARWSKLTAEQRSETMRQVVSRRWK